MTGDVHGRETPANRRAMARDKASTRGQPDPTPVYFTQSAGDTYLRWSVVEVDAHGVPGALGTRCLVFTRQDCIRRVWHYPADWRTLDAEAMAALSWQR